VDAENPESIQIGAKVKIEFDQADDEIYVPYWRVVD
jgi:hypothetical protein